MHQKISSYISLTDTLTPTRPLTHTLFLLQHRSAYDEFIVHQKKISGYISLTDMIRTWFWHAPLDQIKRDNIADLILYGFFYKSR